MIALGVRELDEVDCVNEQEHVAQLGQIAVSLVVHRQVAPLVGASTNQFLVYLDHLRAADDRQRKRRLRLSNIHIKLREIDITKKNMIRKCHLRLQRRSDCSLASRCH